MQAETIRPDLDNTDRYCDLHDLMQAHIDRTVATMPSAHVFTTDAPLYTYTGSTPGLFSLYLREVSDGMPDRRQHYDCRTCRRFVERYGHLVFVGADGQQVPAVWPDAHADGPLGRAIALLHKVVSRSKVTGVAHFDVADRAAWGQRLAGNRPTGEPWSHLSVTPPQAVERATTPRSILDTAYQSTAERHEDHKILTASLADFSRDVVARALGHLRAGQLYRSEVAEQIAAWLLVLHDSLETTKHRLHRDNLVWRAVATAPAGWCHVRSSMLGMLLEDLAAGLPFATSAARWSAKMDPAKYQRPQTSPTAGNVRRAEELFAQLGLATALRRRHARLSDLRLLWSPSYAHLKDTGRTSTAGVFAHLTPAPSPICSSAPAGPAVTMTLDKFRRAVLPTATSIRLVVPSGVAPFAALVTAVDPEALPLVQWDREGDRNPVTWYIHDRSGNPASEWGLRAGEPTAVTGICLSPNLWRGETDPAALHHGRKAFLLLEGARERAGRRGGGLFPSHLRGDLREVRATIEAHSASAVVEDPESGDACGLMLQEGIPWRCDLHVTDRTGVTTRISLDRWD